MDIDFVVTWVDMDDPKWKRDFAKYSGKIDNSKNETTEARFRDHGLLKYWFRGVEKFAPWVRNIHFVTCGQQPEWLDTSHPKLRMVNHEDYIPKQFLPCFNSSLIAIYLHGSRWLAEHVVYFDDDFDISEILPVSRCFSNGVPDDIAAFRMTLGLPLRSQCLKHNIELNDRRLDRKEALPRAHDKSSHQS